MGFWLHTIFCCLPDEGPGNDCGLDERTSRCMGVIRNPWNISGFMNFRCYVFLMKVIQDRTVQLECHCGVLWDKKKNSKKPKKNTQPKTDQCPWLISFMCIILFSFFLSFFCLLAPRYLSTYLKPDKSGALSHGIYNIDWKWNMDFIQLALITLIETGPDALWPTTQQGGLDGNASISNSLVDMDTDLPYEQIIFHQASPQTITWKVKKTKQTSESCCTYCKLCWLIDDFCEVKQ